jgi:hypothetical protein
MMPCPHLEVADELEDTHKRLLVGWAAQRGLCVNMSMGGSRCIEEEHILALDLTSFFLAPALCLQSCSYLVLLFSLL